MSTFSARARAVSILSGLVTRVRARAFVGSGAPVLGRARRVGLLMSAVVTGALWLGAPPALAVQTHVFSSSFGSQGSGVGQVSSPQGVAVSQATGDVYVADTGNARVDEFSSSGTFIRAWGWGVSDGESSFETCTTTCQAGVSGSGAGQFTTPTFVAVDNSAGASAGDVYVGDAGDNLVTKFTAAGALVAAWGSGGQLNGSTATNGPFGSLAGVTVDTGGNLWVYDQNANMFEFGQDGTFSQDWNSGRGVGPGGIDADSAGNLYVLTGGGSVEQFTSTGTDVGPVNGDVSSPTGFAVDRSDNDVYMDNGGSPIYHYPSSCDAGGSCTAADTFGSGDLSAAAGLAVDTSDHTVYAADTGANDVVVFVPATLPDVTTGAPTGIGPTSVTLNGTVNPDGTTITDCHFAYVAQAGYNSSAANPYAGGGTAACLSTPTGSSPVSVSAAVGGLTAGTTYDVQLEASNASGTMPGGNVTFSTLPPPSIDSATVSNLTSGSADVNARINPNGYDTTYHFQYGTSIGYGTSIPVPDADIGSGTSDMPVAQHVSGLSANTTYHWRVVATSANGTTTGGDHTFIYDTTAQGLPDGRAYEMVSPVQKNGAVLGETIFGLSPDVAADGARVIMTSIQCFAGAGGCTASRNLQGSEYEFSRTSAGWVTTPLAPPATQYPSTSTALAVSADAGTALVGLATAPANEDDFYARQPDGTFRDIGPVTPPSAGAEGDQLTGGQVATADLSHVVYALPGSPFWPFDADRSNLYEYVGSGNSQPVLVGVSGGPGSTSVISACGTQLAAPGGSPFGVLSADGSVVYFTAFGTDDPNCVGGSALPADGLYARVDGTLADAHTVLISRRSPADCTTQACTTSAPGDAAFEGASADGSKAFFASTQQLTDNATEGGGSANSNVQGCDAGEVGQFGVGAGAGCNLYLYDFNNPSGHNLVDVSAGDTSGLGPQVQGVVAVSPDGSHVYFVAHGVLSSTPNSQGQHAQPGGENLYVFERDAAFPDGRTSFIATLSGANVGFTGSDSLNWIPGGGWPRANVTPDGRFLVFKSDAKLTADDSSTSGAIQVFRYDAQTGQLNRVSIGNRGFGDNGNGGTGDATIVPERVFRAGPARTNPTMSDNGTRVFFMSPLGLTAHALNDVPVDSSGDLAQNVYEWEQAGVGSCPASQSTGCVYLISDGRDITPTVSHPCQSDSSVCLLGVNTSGENAFFTSADQLAPQDTDGGQLNIWDARVGGGFAYTPPATGCSGDTCQGQPGAPPSVPTAASVTFSGPGNQTGAPATAKVRVLTKTVKGSSVLLRVRVPGKGRVTVTGTQIKLISRAVPRAGTYRLRVRLTGKWKRELKHRHKLKLRLRVSYAPAHGASSSVTFSITDKA